MIEWRVAGYLHSAVLLESTDSDFTLQDQEGRKRVLLGRPELLAKEGWPSWDRDLSMRKWVYPVTAYLDLDEDVDPATKAWHKLETIAARLSFLASAPVTVASYGSVTDSPDPPAPGATYRTISLSWGADAAHSSNRPWVMPETDRESLATLVPDELLGENSWRIDCSMNWLQQSHVAASPIHEFMCLMLAFEALAMLLQPTPPRYWRCSACGVETKVCPCCGESTEAPGPVSHSLRRFVTETLKWSDAEWKEVWKTRNTLFHGSLSVSWVAQPAIARLLKPLETAVILALRGLLRCSQNAPPKAPRRRGFAVGAELRVSWRAPDAQK